MMYKYCRSLIRWPLCICLKVSIKNSTILFSLVYVHSDYIHLHILLYSILLIYTDCRNTVPLCKPGVFNWILFLTISFSILKEEINLKEFINNVNQKALTNHRRILLGH